MKSLTLALMLAAPSIMPATAQISTPRPIIAGNLRVPQVSPDVLKAAADAKMRADLDTAKAQIVQLQSTITKMQQQLHKTTNDAFTTNFYLEKLAKMYNSHIHVVNGTVGTGLTSTIDGDKQFFRYVTPPFNNQDGLQARQTGAPVQPPTP